MNIFIILYFLLFKNNFVQMQDAAMPMPMPMEMGDMGMPMPPAMGAMPPASTTQKPKHSTTILPNPFNTLTNPCGGLFPSLFNKGMIKCQALCTLSGYARGGFCSSVETQSICFCRVY